jgi:hypothetical protein
LEGDRERPRINSCVAEPVESTVRRLHSERLSNLADVVMVAPSEEPHRGAVVLLVREANVIIRTHRFRGPSTPFIWLFGFLLDVLC